MKAIVAISIIESGRLILLMFLAGGYLINIVLSLLVNIPLISEKYELYLFALIVCRFLYPASYVNTILSISVIILDRYILYICDLSIFFSCKNFSSVFIDIFPINDKFLGI